MGIHTFLITKLTEKRDNHPFLMLNCEIQKRETHPEKRETHPEKRETHPEKRETHPEKRETSYTS
jgi:hypothetical protein